MYFNGDFTFENIKYDIEEYTYYGPTSNIAMRKVYVNMFLLENCYGRSL